MAMELLSILVTPVTELSKSLFVLLKRQICYLINYDKNIENLRNEASRLSTKRNDVENSIDEARRRLDEIDEIVLRWLEEADTIGVNVRSLDEQVSENNRCFKGLCPDWKSRRRLSKQAVQLLGVVNEIQANGNFSAVSHVPPPPNVEPVRTLDVERFSSRDLVMNQVMEALRDEHIRSIGLHGMGGVGKTTLVNKLNNELEGSQLFNKVIIVTVSNSPDFKRIQDEIGERLGLKLEPDSAPQVRANKLFKRLQDEEAVLIILDGVWSILQVATDIGIAIGSEYKGCKVIITTRILDVCCEMMIQTVIKVEPLSDYESWVLFNKKVGNVITRPTLLPLARKIAKKCKGSPLAIATVGSSLRDVDEEFEWKNALRTLENSDPIELEGIIPEVIRSLRYSYDHLKGSEIKLCFLFFCLFPEDCDIPLRQMRDYGIAEGFLKVDGSLEDASNKLLVFVRRLKACGLLLDGQEYHVKMHNVVRDVGISIASQEDNGFLVKTGVGLKKWPEMEKLNGYKQISFMRNVGIDELPSPLECPLLQTLLLNRISKLTTIPDNFFERMKALVVLDLSKTGLHSLPKSLGYLTNLRTMYLERCRLLTDISVLGGLKNLEILSLCWSSIERLPGAIGNLTKLRLLDLSYTTWLSSVAPYILSRLTKLEELLMWNSFVDWDMEGCSSGGGGGGEMNASFAEVASLTNLVKLQIHVRNEIYSSPDISYSWENLKELDVWESTDRTTSKPSFRLEMSEHTNSVKIINANMISQWVNILCKRVHELTVENCYGFRNIADLDAVGGFSHLKCLHIAGCYEIEYLISIGEESPQDSFRRLEELKILHMRNMKKIVHCLLPPTKLSGQSKEENDVVAVEGTSSYSGHKQLTRQRNSLNRKSFLPTLLNLKVLNICGCNELRSLFSFRLARCLWQLRELYVSWCEKIEEIIAFEDDEEKEAADHHQGLLPQLRHLDLDSLYNLTSICQGSILLHCSLNHISVVSCPKLKRLPFRPEEGASYPVEISGDISWDGESIL